MYKVDHKLLRSCKKHLTDYLVILGNLKSECKNIKDLNKISRKIVKVYDTINKLKSYNP